MTYLRRLTRVLGIVLPAALTAVLVLIVLSDVVARNVFATSIHWAHDLAIVLLAAAVWLGVAGAAINGQLIGIALFVDMLPPRPRLAALLIADLLVMVIAAAVIRACLAQIATARFTTFLSLGWPKWIVAALLGIGMALVILVRLADLVTRIRESRP